MRHFAQKIGLLLAFCATCLGARPVLAQPVSSLTLQVGQAHVLQEPGVKRIAVGNGKIVQVQALDDRQILLIPENEDYQPIKVTEENNFLIWGIVTHVIKSL